MIFFSMCHSPVPRRRKKLQAQERSLRKGAHFVVYFDQPRNECSNCGSDQDTYNIMKIISASLVPDRYRALADLNLILAP